jgi:hypothetical protein
MKKHKLLVILFQLIKSNIYAGDKIKQIEKQLSFKLRLIIDVILHRNEEANRSPYSTETILKILLMSSQI